MWAGEDGWDIKLALNHIIKDTTLSFTNQDKELAQILLTAFEGRIKMQEEHFQIHLKRLGMKWIRKQGIKTNEFLIEYFGEVYPCWRWYEKEDALKDSQNRGKLSKDLPDFYNIVLERQPDDPAGYNILTIDPILKGSYASRLSHSCFPNCATVIHVHNGKYSIGKCATRDIAYGEELSFDYISVTESRTEYESAVCLWGTFRWVGRFLGLSDNRFTEIMDEYHTLVDRNYIIWYASTYPDLNDIAILNRNKSRAHYLRMLLYGCINGQLWH